MSGMKSDHANTAAHRAVCSICETKYKDWERRNITGELPLMKAIRARLSVEPDVWVFRNEVGNMQRLSDGGIIRVGAGIGSPDLLGAVGGIACWWEVKRPQDRGRTSPEQKTWHVMAAKKGLVGAVVTSLEDAMQVVVTARQLRLLLDQ